MKRFYFTVIGCVVMVLGCETTQTIDSCSNEENTAESAIVDGAAGAGGEGGGSAAPLLGDGAPCSDGAECEHAVCLPSANSFGSGYCYSGAMNGCIVVTDPSPMKVFCASLVKRLYTCGDSTDVSQWGLACAEIGTGDYGERYHCCNNP
jgi:hypothetical protein